MDIFEARKLLQNVASLAMSDSEAYRKIGRTEFHRIRLTDGFEKMYIEEGIIRFAGGPRVYRITVGGIFEGEKVEVHEDVPIGGDRSAQSYFRFIREGEDPETV